MSVRVSQPVLLTPAQLLAAAERVLVNPSCNVQRVSLDEIYTFAIATTQLFELAQLAARQLSGAAPAGEAARLRDHLLSLGILPPTFTLPSQPQKQETHDAD